MPKKPKSPKPPAKKLRKIQSVERITFDREKHCGEMYRDNRGKSKRCTALKGFGTNHPGEGRCVDHTDPEAVNFYLSVRPTRLHYLLERVKSSNSDATDIINELEIMRAMAIAFIEDNSELNEPEAILQASDLLSRITKAAQQLQQMRQAEMIHIKAVELIHVQMASIMMRAIREVADPSKDGWQERLIQWIRSGWEGISVETNPKELRKVTLKLNEATGENQPPPTEGESNGG